MQHLGLASVFLGFSFINFNFGVLVLCQLKIHLIPYMQVVSFHDNHYQSALRLPTRQKQSESMPDSSGVEGSVENPRKRWAEETKIAIEFEEDPHQAALNDNPDLVYVGPRTWGAIFVSINLTVLSFSHADQCNTRLSLCP